MGGVTASRYAADCLRAYLDIETTATQLITVIGVHRPDKGTTQWIHPALDADELRAEIEDVDVLFTYNGGRFDLPIIHRQLGVDLSSVVEHRDLMYDCWKQSLKGGLKAVERRLGIHRDTEGVDGWMAVRLWEKYCRDGDKDAYDLLLKYNREDIENLERLAIRLGVVEAAPGDKPPLIFGAAR